VPLTQIPVFWLLEPTVVVVVDGGEVMVSQPVTLIMVTTSSKSPARYKRFISTTSVVKTFPDSSISKDVGEIKPDQPDEVHR
jgi:hypothetical protein